MYPGLISFLNNSGSLPPYIQILKQYHFIKLQIFINNFLNKVYGENRFIFNPILINIVYIFLKPSFKIILI